MANCDKTEVFLKEWKRMCDAFSQTPCDRCPAYDVCFEIRNTDHQHALVDIVQEWSDEHSESKSNYLNLRNKKSEWTPISIDRPKENEELLITIRASIKNVILRGMYCQGKFCVTVDAGNCISTYIPLDDGSVIAWMLLPKPYKED